MMVGKKINKRIYFLLIGLILLVSIFCINKSNSIPYIITKYNKKDIIHASFILF